MTSDSMSALGALNCLVPKHKAVAEVRELIKTSGIVVHAHWIKAHVGHTYNERADSLAKEATRKPSVDVELPLTGSQLKRHLLTLALARWQERWDQSLELEEYGQYLISPQDIPLVQTMSRVLCGPNGSRQATFEPSLAAGESFRPIRFHKFLKIVLGIK